MIVVDSNILAYLYLPSKHVAEVKRLLAFDSEWAAPVLWRSELINMLCTYRRSGLLNRADSLEIFELAEEVMEGGTFSVAPLKVLEASDRTGCSGYDAEFVSLAQDLGTRLVTYDAPLIKKCPNEACRPSEYIDHPDHAVEVTAGSAAADPQR